MTHREKNPDQLAFEALRPHERDRLSRALKHGATRREVMGMLIAAGATIASASAIVGGATRALAETPKKGGNLRLAWDLHGPSDTLDPVLQTSSIDYSRNRMTYNSLTRLQPDLTVTPEIAESFEANKDSTEWVFQIRKGVEFHDGSKLTADDVVYSMMRHIGPDTTSKGKSLVGDVVEWTKDGDSTVRAKLKNPNVELPIVLGTYHFKIVKSGTTDFSKPVGSGPFKVKEFQPGVRSTHERFDGYWGSGGPYIDTIEMFGITDTVARTNAILSGDVDMIGNLDVKAIDQINANGALDVFTVPSGAYMNINLMLDKMGPGGLDLANGLKHLQRRDRVLQVVQKGQGTLGNDHPIGPAYGVGHCKDLPIREYDPDKAKSLIQKSGLTTAQLDVAEVGPGLTDICLMLQRECAKIGFDLKINKVPNDGYWGAVWLKTPMHVVSWNMRPSANIMMTLAYKSDAPWNETKWKNDRFDSLLVQSRGEPDAAKRYEMLCECQKLIRDESASLIATHRSYVDAKKKSVKGLTTVPLGAFGGNEWPEYVWIDA